MSENDKKKMAKDEFRQHLLKIANDKNWNQLVQSIKERASFSDAAQPLNIEEKKTILHYACEHKDKNIAKDAVDEILKAMISLPYEYDEFQEFVNKCDSTDEKALDIALKKGHDDVVEILLQNSADVSIKFDPKVNGKYHKVLSKFLEDGLSLERDENDPSNEYLWKLKCKFSTLTVASIEGNYRETKTLAKVSKIKDFKTYGLFSCPSVLLFVYEKCHKYKWLLWTSFAVHLFWDILVAVYFYGGLQSSVAGNSTGNGTTNSTDKIPTNSTEILTTNSTGNVTTTNTDTGKGFGYWFHFTVFVVMFAVMTIKEAWKIIFTLFSGNIIYFKQLENYGKFSLLALVVINEKWGPYFWTIFVGILLSFVLILKLFTKTDYFGLHLQIFFKCFILLIGYIISYSPVILIFMVIFTTSQLPNEIDPVLQFSVGLTGTFSKLAGEFNFNDIFSKEKMEDEKNFIYFFIMSGIFLLFILAALLLNTLLVGEVVDNMQKIRRKATASHVMARLEAVHSWESLLFGKLSLKFLELIGQRDNIVKRLSVALPSDSKYTVEFKSLPDYIKDALYNSKSVFPNGVNPEDHEDW